MPSRQPKSSHPTCPNCQGELKRDWLRPIDRFFSNFGPVRRYRCDADLCHWEGNLSPLSLTVAPLRSVSRDHNAWQGVAKT